MGRTLFFLILAITTLGISCTSVKEIVYLEDLPVDEKRVVLDATSYQEPSIQPGDFLNVTVSTIDPLTSGAINQAVTMPAIGFMSAQGSGGTGQILTGFPVDEDGYINMNYIGKIHVAGLSLKEARDEIEARVKENFRTAVVNVVYSNFRVTVLGEVNRPGTMVLPTQKVSVWDAIGMAGDLTVVGRRDNVLLIRRIDEDQTEYVRLNLNSIDVTQSPYFYLRQGDVLYVTPGSARSVATNADRIQVISITSSIVSTLAIIASLIINLSR